MQLWHSLFLLFFLFVVTLITTALMFFNVVAQRFNRKNLQDKNIKTTFVHEIIKENKEQFKN